MKRRNNPRVLPHPIAGGVLALAAAISASTALAFENDHIHSLLQGPDWPVLLGENCSGTQITPHVVISTGDCINRPSLLMYPKIYGFMERDGNAVYSGNDRYASTLGNVGVAFTVDFFNRFKQDLKPANILTYAQEKQVLVDGNNDLTAGAKLALYSATPGLGMTDRYVTSTDWYSNGANTGSPDSRPLIFRSVEKYRQLEPERFLANSSNPLMARDVLDYFYVYRGWQDQQVNKATLLISGRTTDPASATTDPVTPTDAGGGIFYKAPDDTVSLVGIISGNNAHVRLSHYWPWVYEAIKAKNMRAEAIAFSRRVLGTAEWGANDRKGNIGDIFVYDNPYTGEVEFLRLIRRGSDQRYWYFPTNKKDNYYWQYLGTSLPTFAQAVAPELEGAPEDRSDGSVQATATATSATTPDPATPQDGVLQPVTGTASSAKLKAATRPPLNSSATAGASKRLPLTPVNSPDMPKQEADVPNSEVAADNTWSGTVPATPGTAAKGEYVKSLNGSVIANSPASETTATTSP